jgi:hypothetical protein
MWRTIKMRQKLNVVLLAALTVLVAGPSFAQAVAYSGKLQIGFGDQDNTLPTAQRSNNAIPICAGRPPSNLIATAPAGTTLGTLIVNGRGTQGAGPGKPLTFSAVTDTTGGAQEYEQGTCNVAIPGFANPRLRSRTQVGAAHWPARKGPFTTNLINVPVPATPTATYMLSRASTAPNTTTAKGGIRNGGNAAGTLTTSLPIFVTGGGSEKIVPGANRFGGGVPFSGGGGVQLGVNFTVLSPGGMTLAPGDYGLALYANGFLPTDPQPFGTKAKGVSLLNVDASGNKPPPASYINGVVLGRQDLQYAARTPGGTTKGQEGAIRTLGGGNTATPFGVFTIPAGPAAGVVMDCVTQLPLGPCPQIISPVAFSAVMFEWTTGSVTHTDMIGDFTTIRTAMGFDTPGAGVGGATRHLQLVTPWAASIETVGNFGLSALLPVLGFGGIGQLDLHIIPVPEPGTLAMLGFGVAGLVGLRGARRRS